MKKILFLTLLMCTHTFSQWNTNTAVNTVASNSGEDMQSVAMSNGKTYIVFWKPVASPTNYELRMQVLDAAGNKELGDEGVVVGSVPMSTYTVIWSINVDSSDNLYIGVTGTDNESGYVFKMNPSGNAVWASPISLTGAYQVSATPLSTGETLVTWLDVNTYITTMQKYSASGTAVWTTNKTAPIGNSNTAPGDAFEISGNNFILVFHELGFGINSTLYAQRFDASGDAVWTNPIPLSNEATAFNRSYSGVQDGDVVYYGYYASSGVRFDSYLQRINANGTLPWGINGMDFDTNETNYEQTTSIAFNPGSNYIWSVCNYTNASQSDAGLYIQKFDKATGARQFTDNAKQIYAIGSDKVHYGKLHAVGDNALFLIKSGVDNGASPVSLHACLLDTNGDFVWTGDTKPMATFAASKSRVQFNKPVNGQAVTVFIEDKGSGAKIYAQNLNETELSVNENSVQEIVLQYNNPVTSILNITSNEPIKQIQVYNILGKTIFNKSNQNANRMRINTSAWSKGVYLVVVNTLKGNKTLKITKA